MARNDQSLVDCVMVAKYSPLFFFKKKMMNILLIYTIIGTGPRSAVGNVSGYRCVSDCRSRGREFDPGSVPYFLGD